MSTATPDSTSVSRHVTITISNITPFTLAAGRLTLVHGGVTPDTPPPPKTIAAGTSVVFRVSNGTDQQHGAQGSVSYTLAAAGPNSQQPPPPSKLNGHNIVTIAWNHGLDPKTTPSTYTLPAVPPYLCHTVSPASSFARQCHQQCVSFVVSAKPTPFADWCVDYAQVLQSRTVRQLCLPGAHDSGSYSLSDEVMPDAPKWLKTLKKVSGDAFIPIVRGWAVSQDPDAAASMPPPPPPQPSSMLAQPKSPPPSPPKASVYDQLIAGVRYLDVRTCYDATRKQCRIVHSLYGCTLTQFLADVARFTHAHPREIVLLDFNHFYEMTADTHAQLVSVLQSTFGASLVTKTLFDHGDVTVATLWQHQSTVHVFYSADDIVQQYPFLLSHTTYIESPWADTATVADLKQKLDTFVAAQQPSTLFVLQCILTETEKLVIGGVLNPNHGTAPHSLEELSWRVNSVAGQWFTATSASSSSSASPGMTPFPATARLNVLLGDWVTSWALVPLAIARCVSATSPTSTSPSPSLPLPPPSPSPPQWHFKVTMSTKQPRRIAGWSLVSSPSQQQRLHQDSSVTPSALSASLASSVLDEDEEDDSDDDNGQTAMCRFALPRDDTLTVQRLRDVLLPSILSSLALTTTMPTMVITYIDDEYDNIVVDSDADLVEMLRWFDGVGGGSGDGACISHPLRLHVHVMPTSSS